MRCSQIGTSSDTDVTVAPGSSPSLVHSSSWPLFFKNADACVDNPTTDNAFTRRFGPRRGMGLAGMWHALVTRPLVTLAIATPAAVAVFLLEAWDPNRGVRDRYGLWVFVAAILPGLVATVCQQKVPRWVNATYFCAVGFGITVAYVVLILQGIGKLSTPKRSVGQQVSLWRR